MAKKHLDFVKRIARQSHGRWIDSNPSATLGDLHSYLEVVRDELSEYDPDDVLAEIIDELDLAADYLSDFDEVDEPVFDDELATVDYRMANVEEDIGDVEELIESLGASFRVSRLPKWKLL